MDNGIDFIKVHIAAGIAFSFHRDKLQDLSNRFGADAVDAEIQLGRLVKELI